MVNLNIFGRDWRENLKQKQKEVPVILDHETGKVMSERRIHKETQEAVLRAMMEMAKQHQGL